MVAHGDDCGDGSARATSSLPVPLSPKISTVTSWQATRPIALYTSCIAVECPTIDSPAASTEVGDMNDMARRRTAELSAFNARVTACANRSNRQVLSSSQTLHTSSSRMVVSLSTEVETRMTGKSWQQSPNEFVYFLPGLFARPASIHDGVNQRCPSKICRTSPAPAPAEICRLGTVQRLFEVERVRRLSTSITNR